ncbi:unnamed protein product [Mytilus coruscus]|uniref:Uncharacterized protein n=1 Tax=Mytilus coruscus TaxID=42192 RepID=A0A6J8D4F7_MYTCO|nr:unnamed protein product [Mytilus coruscus]
MEIQKNKSPRKPHFSSEEVDIIVEAVQENYSLLFGVLSPNLDLHNEKEGNLVKYSSETRKVRKYLESGGDKFAFIKDLQKDPGQELPFIFKKYGITSECLVDRNILPIDHPVSLSVADVLFLRRLLCYKNLPWTHAEYWVNTLLRASVSVESIRLQWNNIHKKFHDYRTSGSPGAGEDLSTFMSGQYHHPTTHFKSSKPNLETVA